MVDEKRDVLQSEVISILRDNGDNGIVLIPTGTGKTRIIVERLKELAARYPVGSFIYTCDNRLLRDGGFNGELIKWGAADLIPRIQCECYAAAYKFVGRSYDVWIGDEFDYMLSPEYIKFALNNEFKHKILVSATLSPEKRALALEIAPILYEIKTSEVEQRGIINKTKHRIVPYMLNEWENNRYLQFNESMARIMNPDEECTQEEKDMIIRRRVEFLSNLDSSRAMCRALISYLYKNVPGTRCLVYSGSKEQLLQIMPWTYFTGNEKEEWLDKFNQELINFLGIIGKVDRGTNLNGVNTIIYERVQSSQTKMIQRSGRGKRLQQDLLLNAYYLIPFYKTEHGNIKPTVVARWLDESIKTLDTSNIEKFIIPCTEKTST